jgi:hypothetical protein
MEHKRKKDKDVQQNQESMYDLNCICRTCCHIFIYISFYFSTRPLLWDVAVTKVKAKEEKLDENEQLETDRSLLIAGARESVNIYFTKSPYV